MRRLVQTEEMQMNPVNIKTTEQLVMSSSFSAHRLVNRYFPHRWGEEAKIRTRILTFSWDTMKTSLQHSLCDSVIQELLWAFNVPPDVIGSLYATTSWNDQKIKLQLRGAWRASRANNWSVENHNFICVIWYVYWHHIANDQHLLFKSKQPRPICIFVFNKLIRRWWQKVSLVTSVNLNDWCAKMSSCIVA